MNSFTLLLFLLCPDLQENKSETKLDSSGTPQIQTKLKIFKFSPMHHDVTIKLIGFPETEF